MTGLRRSPLVVLAVLAVLALGPFAAVGAAQSYVVVDSVRLPAESFVGDPVELRYTLRTEAELRSPSAPPEPDWGEIESIRVTARDVAYDVRITVVPYEPGTLTLPPVDLGGLVLEGLSLAVASVLGEDAELRSIYGPQRLPGTRLAILLVALGVIVPGALALYLVGPGRELVRWLVERHRARLPYRNLMRTIDRLEGGLPRDSAREFYTILVGSIQDLMTSRLGFECRSATSRELEAYLPMLAARCGAAASVAEPLAEVLRSADPAKFAHSQVRRKVRSAHLAICRETMAELESSRRRIRREHAARGTRRKEATGVGV